MKTLKCRGHFRQIVAGRGGQFVICGLSGGQWTVHQVVDSPADSLADGMVVWRINDGIVDMCFVFVL